MTEPAVKQQFMNDMIAKISDSREREYEYVEIVHQLKDELAREQKKVAELERKLIEANRQGVTRP